MTLRRMLPLLFILSVLSFAAGAWAQVGGLVKVVPLQGENAVLDIRAGDFVFDRVQVRHQPDAVALAKAEADTRLDWRPRISVDYSNPGPTKMALSMQVTLQDARGTPFLTCEDRATVRAFDRRAFTVLCATRPMILRDWPRVTHVKFVGTAMPLGGAVDKAYPVMRGIAEIREAVGPVVMEKLIVPNFPTESEIAQARYNPATKRRVKIVLMVSNSSPSKVKVRVTATLLDRTGAVIASCNETENIRGGARMRDITVCPRAEMRTSEWPNVTHARVSLSVL